MSGIISRTAYYEKGADGAMKFHDYSTVLTGIGVMVELAQPLNLRKSAFTAMREYDPTDQMVRVDELKEFAIGTPYTGAQWIWGTASPKSGR